jgi:hypothetical protein
MKIKLFGFKVCWLENICRYFGRRWCLYLMLYTEHGGTMLVRNVRTFDSRHCVTFHWRHEVTWVISPWAYGNFSDEGVKQPLYTCCCRRTQVVGVWKGKKCLSSVLLNDSLSPHFWRCRETRRIFRKIYMCKFKSTVLLCIFAKCYRPEICALLGCSGNSSPTFRENL